MDIAITGASGLIGSELARLLSERGDRVLRLVRRAPTSSDELRWDPTQGTIDSAGLEGIDAVVNLAGENIAARRWSTEQKAKIVDSRVKGTNLLASTIVGAQKPPRVLVSGSAIGFYGDRGDEQLDETSPAGAGFLADVVTQWEAAAAPVSEAGIRVAFARTGLVLSQDAGALVPLLRIFKLGLGGKLGSGRQWWSWITLEDDARALVHLIDHEVAGPVNLVSPSPVTNAAFTKALGTALHRPAILPVPSFGPKLVMGAELADELIFASQRIAPAVLTGSGFAFSHPQLDDALTSVLARS
jgi:uncharacterized protein (TIGR01777 family)